MASSKSPHGASAAFSSAAGGVGGASNAAAQNSVAERRLRPIYDWLDNGNNKKALQEADKVLKKQPDFACCKVLKCLALLRMGNEEKAVPLLDAVLADATTDEGALNAMSIAYRELQQPDKICTMYELATKKEPQNEELLSHLFMSYVRMGYYKKQQQAAMALYKARPKNPYYFWSVMSVVLQATSSGLDDKLSQAVTLPLAERMVAKMDKEQKMEQEQETHLYLMILELQHKFKEALAVLDGPLGAKLEEQTSYLNFLVMKRIEYNKKVERWERVNVLTKQNLQELPDQWNWYVDYVTSVFRLLDAATVAAAQKDPLPSALAAAAASAAAADDGEAAPSSAAAADVGEVDTTVAAAMKFIRSMQSSHRSCRGPYLAEMELVSRQIARRDSALEEDALSTLLLAYFRKFGTKPSCFADVKLFLPSLTRCETEKFLVKSLEIVGLKHDGVPEKLDAIHRHCCWHEMCRFMGRHAVESVDERVARVRRLVRCYDGAQHVVKDFASTELRPSDVYVMLSGHLLWDLWVETGEDRFFWQAVTLLQAAIKISAANYHIRFLLIRYLNQVGAVGVALSVHSGLELKHVQLDSLGYLMSRHILTCGHLNTASNLFGNTLKFFTGNYKDIVDHIIQAYRCGSFDKIVEFIKLRERLSHSQHSTSLTVERMLLDLLVETTLHGQTVQMMSYLEIDPDKDEVAWTQLTDNRDFQALVSWDPPDRLVSDELISESFELDQKFLRCRSLTMRALAAAVYMSEDIHPARRSSSCESSNGLCGGEVVESDKLSRLSSVLAALRTSLLSSSSSAAAGGDAAAAWPLHPLQGPYRSRLQLYLRDGHAQFTALLLQLVLAVNAAASGAARAADGADDAPLNDLPARVARRFADMVDAQRRRIREGVALAGREEHIEAIINIVESSSFTGILCGVCQSLLSSVGATARGGGAGSNRKHKKKREIHAELVSFRVSFNALISSMETQLRALLAVAEDFEKLVQLDALLLKTERQLASIDLGAETERQPASRNFGAETERQLASRNFGAETERQPASRNYGAETERQPASINLGAETERQPASRNFGAETERQLASIDLGAETERQPASINLGAEITQQPHEDSRSQCQTSAASAEVSEKGVSDTRDDADSDRRADDDVSDTRGDDSNRSDRSDRRADDDVSDTRGDADGDRRADDDPVTNDIRKSELVSVADGAAATASDSELQPGDNSSSQRVVDIASATSASSSSQRVVDMSVTSASTAADAENRLNELAREAVLEEVHVQMESSYQVSFLQIKTVIQNKINYFSFLKL